MGQVVEAIQDKFRTSWVFLALFSFRAIISLFIGVTFAIVGEQIIGYENFAYIFVMVVTFFLVMKVTRPWTWVQNIVFCLVCVLIGLLLRMYILVAPGI